MKKLCLAAAALTFCVAPALAAHVQPGLWEGSLTRQNDKAMAALQNLPPAVRARMKAQGIDINGATVKTRFCISQKMANMDRFDNNQVEGCRETGARWAGSTRIADAECKLPNMTSKSHTEVTFESPKHYFGKITSDSTFGGKPHHSEMTIDGRFIDANCGKVEPALK